MAKTGPNHYRDAMRLYEQAKRKTAPAEKTALLQEASFLMQAALVAALVHSGTAEESIVKEWMKAEVRIGDRHGR
jgi:hypothetical protein